jgi:hypothetical protein
MNLSTVLTVSKKIVAMFDKFVFVYL